jgi:hypothetical protein
MAKSQDHDTNENKIEGEDDNEDLFGEDGKCTIRRWREGRIRRVSKFRKDE